MPGPSLLLGKMNTTPSGLTARWVTRLDLPPLNEANWGARILGDHTMTMLKRQLKQVMEQVGCERVTDLPKHLVPSSA
jgi:hypothetical protein